MLRKFTILLILWGLSLNLSAQDSIDFETQINLKRKEISQSFETQYNALLLPKSEVISKARRLNIPIFLEMQGGQNATLQYFDENNFPIYYSIFNVGAANTVGASALQPNGSLGLNLTGKGITVGIYDQTRPKPDHAEFAGRLTQIDGSSETISNHATHVTGTVLAAGINPSARGMAYEATGWSFNWDADLSKMNTNAYDPVAKTNGHIVSNHSYGIVTGWYRNSSGAWAWSGNSSVDPNEDYRFGFYSNKSKGLDDLAFSKPFYTIVWAAGNDRNDTGDGTRAPDGPEDSIGPEGVAKNIITVGAVSSVSSYSGPNSVSMSSFSSWGPTDDGRIKPDLVGVGVGVFSSTISNGGESDNYGSLSGTSMASPNVAGTLVLLQQLFRERNNSQYMLSATLKALALNTTKEAGLYDGPDYVYGWGLLNAEEAASIILNEDGSSNVIRETSILQGEVYEFEFVSDGVTPIRATIAWTDPSGAVSPISLNPTDLKLVNDLDLRIFDDQGKEFFPWSLDPSRGATGPAVQTQDNFRDNVEQIYISNPESRKYTVRVSHKGSLINGGQNFSFVMTAGTLEGNSETLYWIGPENGDWNSPANWSLSMGGVPANKIPAEDTRVIFENSASSVNSSTNIQAFSLNAFGDNPVDINLNGNQLLISNGLRLSNSSTTIRNGSLVFESESSNELLVSLLNSNFENLMLDFKSGNWRILESSPVDAINIATDVTFNQDTFEANDFNIVSTGRILGNLSEIGFTEKANFDDGSSVPSDLQVNFKGTNTGQFNWDLTTPLDGFKVSGSGEVNYLQGQSINTLSIEGGLFNLGIPNLNLGSIEFANGGDLNLGTSGRIVVQTDIISSNSESVRSSIRAGSKGFIQHNLYKKYCLAGIDVLNVDFEGDALVNLGQSAEVENSQNWIELRCEDVLFANFESSFLCVGGVAEFTNLSEGEIANYSWTIDGVEFSNEEIAYYQFSESGNFTVSLTISSGDFTTTFDENIEVQTSSLVKPSIVVNGSTLTSQNPGERYQWYQNGVPIDGATQRSYQVSGDGSYQVATFSGACNRISDPLVITAILKDEPDLSRFGVFIGPNPTDGMINVSISNEYIGEIGFDLIDISGRVIENLETYKSEQNLDVQFQLNGPKGLYLVLIKTNSYILRKKIIKK